VLLGMEHAFLTAASGDLLCLVDIRSRHLQRRVRGTQFDALLSVRYY
jgi:hypothetical protein